MSPSRLSSAPPPVSMVMSTHLWTPPPSISNQFLLSPLNTDILSGSSNHSRHPPSSSLRLCSFVIEDSSTCRDTRQTRSFIHTRSDTSPATQTNRLACPLPPCLLFSLACAPALSHCLRFRLFNLLHPPSHSYAFFHSVRSSDAPVVHVLSYTSLLTANSPPTIFGIAYATQDASPRLPNISGHARAITILSLGRDSPMWSPEHPT